MSCCCCCSDRFLNNGLIAEARYREHPSTDGYTELYLGRVSVEDTGTYKLVAVNGFGTSLAALSSDNTLLNEE